MKQCDRALDTEQICVLNLTSDAGHGHRSAAEAIEAAIKQRHGERCKIVTVNPADDPSAPGLLRDGEEGYNHLIRKKPELYESAYQFSDSQFASTLVDAVLGVLLYETMRDLVQQHQPDVIVTTYPLYQGPVEALRLASGQQIPLVTVVTDLVSLHSVWFSQAADLCVVPTDEARSLALKNGLDSEKITVCGIPVHPDISHKSQSVVELRDELGWQQDIPAFLAVGGKLVNGLLASLRALDHSALSIQLAVVTGHDKELQEQLDAIEWHIETHVYGYVSDMPTMMAACDAIICKAGGLTVAEALASGLPMVLMDVIPGQEEGNAQYVSSHGAGELAGDPVDVLEVVSHWLDQDCSLLVERADKAQQLGCPDAAFEIADLVVSIARHGI